LTILADLIAWLKAEEVAGVAELRLALKLQAEGVKKSRYIGDFSENAV
jgi:hypothetical protein